MEKGNFIKVLLNYNENKITDKEFVDFLNNNEELQKIFNKSLKSYLTSFDTSVVARINKDYATIGTAQDKFTADSHRSVSSFDIHFLVKELISKKYYKFLSKEDSDNFILNAITDMNGLYNAEKNIEDFIKSKIIDKMPKFDKSNDAIKFAKTKVKEAFICEKNMPNWAQSCEWPFDKKGNPMKFVSQKKDGDKVEYLFLDTCTNEKKVVVQYY